MAKIKLTDDYVSKVRKMESSFTSSNNITWAHLGGDEYVFSFEGEAMQKWYEDKFGETADKTSAIEFEEDDIYEITNEAIQNKEVETHDKILLDYLIKTVLDENV